jgi:hypothetical protein
VSAAAAAIAATTATIAAVAVATTTVATTMATAMATTTVAVATAAAAASTTITRAATATMATMAGDSRLLTTQEGDADDRDKNRDPHNQSAVHPRILQQKNRYLGVTKQLPSDFSPPPGTAAKRRYRFPSIPMLAASVGLMRQVLIPVSFDDYADKRE